MVSAPPIAVLPMYDWPEVKDETDALWDGLRSALIAIGLNAPARLTRPCDLWDAWRDPGLLIGQTCGLPLVRHLGDAVCVLGAPAYRVPDCRPGTYRSVVVVRHADDARTIDDLRGRVVAFNHSGSQSGDGALRHLVAPRSRDGRFFSRAIETGSHRAALRAVAEGVGDVAAIDAVSWALAERHEDAAGALRVLVRTPPTPGLPFITAPRALSEVARMRCAIARAIELLSAPIRDALFLDGFVPLTRNAYDVVAARDAMTDRLGYGTLS